MKVNKYYSFKEILIFFQDESGVENIPSAPNTTKARWFTSLLTATGRVLNLVGFKANSTTIPEATINNYIDDLINIVFNRHADDYIAEIKHYLCEFEDEDVDLSNASYMGLDKLINVINLTAPRYIPILVSYLDNYEEPIKMLESISESFSRYNDTPQNDQDDVDYNTPEYATNMGKNKNVSRIDSGSVIDRLKSLTESFRSIILDWSNEFNQLFLNDLQLEY